MKGKSSDPGQFGFGFATFHLSIMGCSVNVFCTLHIDTEPVCYIDTETHVLDQRWDRLTEGLKTNQIGAVPPRGASVECWAHRCLNGMQLRFPVDLMSVVEVHQENSLRTLLWLALPAGLAPSLSEARLLEAYIC